MTVYIRTYINYYLLSPLRSGAKRAFGRLNAMPRNYPIHAGKKEIAIKRREKRGGMEKQRGRLVGASEIRKKLRGRFALPAQAYKKKISVNERVLRSSSFCPLFLFPRASF